MDTLLYSIIASSVMPPALFFFDALPDPQIRIVVTARGDAMAIGIRHAPAGDPFDVSQTRNGQFEQSHNYAEYCVHSCRDSTSYSYYSRVFEYSTCRGSTAVLFE